MFFQGSRELGLLSAVHVDEEGQLLRIVYVARSQFLQDSLELLFNVA